MLDKYTPCNYSISILGAGMYGTALAITLARNGHLVLLWGHKPEYIEQLQSHRCNISCLPNISFSTNLVLETDLSKAVRASRDLLIVVPSHVFGELLIKIKPYLTTQSRILWATKGLEKDTGCLLQDVAQNILGNDIALAVLSGPTFANELAQGLPTAISISSNNEKFAEELQNKLHCSNNFRVYNNSDLIGVQIGGAVKNIIAIGVGISDGMGFGSNARIALITRGLAEIRRLGLVLGAKAETFMGMACLGDLVLTCTDNQSRNRRFGLLIGQGKSVSDAQNIIGQVIEGYRNNKEVKSLAHRVGVDMPINEQIYQVLYCHKSTKEAALSLLNRSIKNENN